MTSTLMPTGPVRGYYFRGTPSRKYLQLMAEAQAEFDAWDTWFLAQLEERRRARRERKARSEKIRSC